MHYQFRPPQSFPIMNPGTVNRQFPLSAPMGHPNFIPGPQVFYSNAKLQNINCILQHTENEGGLFLGDVLCLIKKQILTGNDINAILTCMTSNDAKGANIDFDNIKASANIKNHKLISARDALDYPLDVHFQESFEYIESMRKEKNNILVHCHAGVSRSATIVCAYLMKKNNWDRDQALIFLKSRRQRVRPNQNFLQLLKNYEISLHQNKKTPLQTPRKQIGSHQQSFISHQNHIGQRKTEGPKDIQIQEITSHTNILYVPEKQASQHYYSPQKNLSSLQNSRERNINIMSQNKSTNSVKFNNHSKSIEHNNNLKFSRTQDKRQQLSNKNPHYFNNDGSITIFSASKSYGLGESDLAIKNNKSSLLSTGDKQSRKGDQSKIAVYEAPKSQNRIGRNKIFTPSKPHTPQLTPVSSTQKNANLSFLTVASLQKNKQYTYGLQEIEKSQSKSIRKKQSNQNCFLQGIKRLCS